MNTPQKEVVRRWFHEVFTNGNIEVLKEITKEDFVVHAPGEAEGNQGREQFVEWLNWYRSAFADDQWTIEDMIEEGNKVAARYTGHTTYRGGLFNIPSRNQRIRETGIIIFHFEDGMIKEMWPEMSDLQVMQQLGAFPDGDGKQPS
ncbi:MAG: ester cyclase [Bacillaceae bacterium]|nr:ester cyclase [Bacillaceae bacterium]